MSYFYVYGDWLIKWENYKVDKLGQILSTDFRLKTLPQFWDALIACISDSLQFCAC